MRFVNVESLQSQASLRGENLGRRPRRRRDDSAPKPGQAQFPKGYGPPVQLGSHLQIAARPGYRSASIKLKEGLYLVAEVPEPTVEQISGVAALLAPSLINAATQALVPGAAAAQPDKGTLTPESKTAVNSLVQQATQVATQALTAPEYDDYEEDLSGVMVPAWAGGTQLAGLIQGARRPVRSCGHCGARH